MGVGVGVGAGAVTETAAAASSRPPDVHSDARAEFVAAEERITDLI